MMRKMFTSGIILFIIIILTACKNEVVNVSSAASLEDIKNTLTDAGYIIVENYEEFYDIDENLENSVGGFSFIFPGAHGSVYIPVFEFRDNASAEFYAELVNVGGHYLAIINDSLLTIADAHHGIPHENEKVFFENLINGKSIK